MTTIICKRVSTHLVDVFVGQGWRNHVRLEIGYKNGKASSLRRVGGKQHLSHELGGFVLNYVSLQDEEKRRSLRTFNQELEKVRQRFRPPQKVA